MKFIRPKTQSRKVTYSLSQRTIDILSLYAKYTQYSEDELIDNFMQNLTLDKRFIKWAKKQRNRKKIDALLFDEDLDELDSGDEGMGESNGEAEETDTTF